MTTDSTPEMPEVELPEDVMFDLLDQAIDTGRQLMADPPESVLETLYVYLATAYEAGMKAGTAS